jgi:hypothetical protein
MPIPAHLRTRSNPNTIWYIAGAGVLLVGYLWYRSRQNSSSGASTDSTATAPTLDSTGYTSDITDTSNDLPYEDTWPYNQLALPYDYTQGNSNLVDQNANYLLPNQPDFIGNQQTATG